MSAVLSVHGLSIGYEALRPLACGLDLSFRQGELVCLAGPNGSGKSTLLRTLAGLLPPLAGELKLEGLSLQDYGAQARARRLAVVFARFPMGTLLTGREFVALGRSPYAGWFDRLTPRDHQAVEEALALADALHLAPLKVDDLSDGERQRLAVARALAQQTPVVLLDEPTAFLDLPHRMNLYRTLRELARTRRLCVVMSSHELDLALRFADRMVLLDGKGQAYSGLPEVLALEGAVARAFAAPDVRFDLDSGNFVVDAALVEPVCCLGEGMEAQWTRRALHRLGYKLLDRGYPRVRVQKNGDSCRWAVSFDEGQEIFSDHMETALALLPGCGERK